jgi:putative hydrolase of the HAD superfamily
VTKWQAIVFDLDDTLYPERQYVLSGMQAVALWARRELGLASEHTFAELRRLFEQGVRGDTFDRWLTGHGLKPADWVATMVDVYRSHKPQIALAAEVRELLVRLRRDYRLGLVTDGYLNVQRRKVAALGLERYFDAIIYSDAWGREAWKPCPRPFEEALRQLSVAGPDTVYVGDNPTKDFHGARTVGMGTVRVRLRNALNSRLEPPCPAHAPDVEIAGLEHLEAALLAFPQSLVRRTSPRSTPPRLGCANQCT